MIGGLPRKRVLASGLGQGLLEWVKVQLGEARDPQAIKGQAITCLFILALDRDTHQLFLKAQGLHDGLKASMGDQGITVQKGRFIVGP